MKSNIRCVCFLLILLTMQVAATECVAVEGPVVRVSALAQFVDQAPALELDRILTSTPDPGTRRWVTPSDLRKWGVSLREGLAGPAICLERRLQSLQLDDVMREVQAALEQSHGKVQNVGITSVQPLLVPEGHLSLTPAGFRALSANNGFCSFLWQAAVDYDSHRLIAVKILGRYQAETVLIAARHSLQVGDVLGASDYERITKPGCTLQSIELAPPEGFVMRRALSSGDEIKAAMLKAPAVVEQGAAIRVIALAGGASVSIEAIAEKPGRRGETVFVRNRESGKRIRVLLTGMGEASAVVAGTAR